VLTNVCFEGKNGHDAHGPSANDPKRKLLRNIGNAAKKRTGRCIPLKTRGGHVNHCALHNNP
jgi:hypothetical protein